MPQQSLLSPCAFFTKIVKFKKIAPGLFCHFRNAVPIPGFAFSSDLFSSVVFVFSPNVFHTVFMSLRNQRFLDSTDCKTSHEVQFLLGHQLQE